MNVLTVLSLFSLMHLSSLDDFLMQNLTAFTSMNPNDRSMLVVFKNRWWISIDGDFHTGVVDCRDWTTVAAAGIDDASEIADVTTMSWSGCSEWWGQRVGSKCRTWIESEKFSTTHEKRKQNVRKSGRNVSRNSPNRTASSVDNVIDIVISEAAADSQDIGTKASNVVNHGAVDVFTSATSLSIELVTKNSNLIFQLLDAVAMSTFTVFDHFLNLETFSQSLTTAVYHTCPFSWRILMSCLSCSSRCLLVSSRILFPFSISNWAICCWSWAQFL